MTKKKVRRFKVKIVLPLFFINYRKFFLLYWERPRGIRALSEIGKSIVRIIMR